MGTYFPNPEPGQVEKLFAGPQVPSVDTGGVVTGATHMA
jgi:hypothetical protein